MRPLSALLLSLLVASTGCHDWARVRSEGADDAVSMDAADDAAQEGGSPDGVGPDRASDAEPGGDALPDASPAVDVIPDAVALDVAVPDDQSMAPDAIARDAAVDAAPACGSLGVACCPGATPCGPWSNCASSACTACGGDHEPVCDSGAACRPGFSEPGHSGMCH